jgi:hypothetical protein
VRAEGCFDKVALSIETDDPAYWTGRRIRNMRRLAAAVISVAAEDVREPALREDKNTAIFSIATAPVVRIRSEPRDGVGGWTARAPHIGSFVGDVIQ